MYLNDLELERLAHCPTLYHVRLYVAALRLQKEDPMPPWKFFKKARVSPDRAKGVLRELVVTRRWLQREAYGPPGRTRTVRYVSTAKGQGISHDPLVAGPRDLTRSFGQADQGIPDDPLVEGGKGSQTIPSSLNPLDLPSGEVVYKTEPSVRTEGMQGEGTDGRTDGSQKFVGFAPELVGSIVDAWQIPKPAVEKCVGRFFDELSGIAPEPTERELSRFFRAAFDHREQRHTHPAFSGVVYERFLGCVCTLLRFGLWRDHERKQLERRELARARDREQERDDDARLSPTELLALLDERAKAASS